MWYNPEIYISSENLSDTQILWAMYQHQVATTAVLISIVAFYFLFKFILWVVPFQSLLKTKKEKDKK